MPCSQGNYPVVREDASQMCALQIQAEHASTLNDNEEQVMNCIEKYITKQVRLRSWTQQASECTRCDGTF